MFDDPDYKEHAERLRARRASAWQADLVKDFCRSAGVPVPGRGRIDEDGICVLSNEYSTFPVRLRYADLPSPFSLSKYFLRPLKTPAWGILMKEIDACPDRIPVGIVFPSRGGGPRVLHTWWDSEPAPGRLRIVRAGSRPGMGVVLERWKDFCAAVKASGWHP